MARRESTPVSESLVDEIDNALAAVDAARGEMEAAVLERQPMLVRREAHARLGAAFDEADRLLRQATRAARDHSHQRGFYRTWSHWRHRLSRLDAARQQHLFLQADDQVLGLGSIRAVDTGLSGPAIGDLVHGEASEPGASPRYGLDLDAVLSRASKGLPGGWPAPGAGRAPANTLPDSEPVSRRAARPAPPSAPPRAA
ncbi:MAG TPA: hypothetical protein VFG63_10490 [Nocardioidaceae bacterium]|nr:hypothetical protein [Nocardioidaceae bacterium]